MRLFKLGNEKVVGFPCHAWGWRPDFRGQTAWCPEDDWTVNTRASQRFSFPQKGCPLLKDGIDLNYELVNGHHGSL